jgi:hypothetical protein
VAGVLEETGGKFRERQQSLVADQIEMLAKKTQDLSGYLRTHSFEDVVSDAESYARRNPALVVGAAGLAGFVGARIARVTRSIQPASGRPASSVPTSAVPTSTPPSSRLPLSGPGPERPPVATPPSAPTAGDVEIA